jgi:hypothetical protein
MGACQAETGIERVYRMVDRQLLLASVSRAHAWGTNVRGRELPRGLSHQIN